MKKIILMLFLLLVVPMYAVNVTIDDVTYTLTGLIQAGDRHYASATQDDDDSVPVFLVASYDGGYATHDALATLHDQTSLSATQIAFAQTDLTAQWGAKYFQKHRHMQVASAFNALMTFYGSYHVLRNVYSLGCYLKKKASQKA